LELKDNLSHNKNIQVYKIYGNFIKNQPVTMIQDSNKYKHKLTKLPNINNNLLKDKAKLNKDYSFFDKILLKWKQANNNMDKLTFKLKVKLSKIHNMSPFLDLTNYKLDPL
jgi:hypothetical protein